MVASPTTVSAGPHPDGGAEDPETVLIVDDDALSAKMTAIEVTAIGYRAVVATKWMDALKEVATGSIDLVLMDAVMPTVDGYKLTRLMRERVSTYVPIVFVTALRDAEARARCVDAGADDLLNKPVDTLELRVRLKAMLRIRRLTQSLEAKRKELDELARTDALTGLLNRRALDRELPLELVRARRYERSLSVVMADIDHFKQLNDSEGHAAGDDVLQQFAKQLRSGLRSTDSVFRSGGEEFVLLLSETAAEGAVVVAERVRTRFSAARRVAGSSGGRSASFGVVSRAMLGDDADAAALLEAADAAMYAAKAAGRDRVFLWQPTL